VQTQAPRIDFGPGLFAAFDLQEGVEVFIKMNAEFR
jgi:hypothetical protein